MKHNALARLILALGSSMITASAFAHHAFSAQFDADKPLTLTGTVTKVEWQNPHTWFYIDVIDESGNRSSWGLEMASPNLLMRAGWRRDSMNVGDIITVEAFHAKNGKNIANAQVVTLTATGQRLFSGSNDGRGR